MNKWIQKNYDHISNVGSAIVSVLLSMLAGFISKTIVPSDEATTSTDIYVTVTLIFFAGALIVILSLISAKIKKKLFKESDYNKYVQKAYLAIQDYSFESQNYYQEIDSGNLNSWFLHNIQLTVNKCYDFFASSYTSGEIVMEETKFEVTFMTKSYKDKKITIPCSCNKEKRTPTSMLLRENNPDIYADTITAEVYKEYEKHCKPTFRIIENTEDPKGKTGYHFVYDNQRQRIKSTVVLPVLSHKNELLGTLVVHCNTPDFFKENQRAFWYEILQLFACEIGKNKLLLDSTVSDKNKPF